MPLSVMIMPSSQAEGTRSHTHTECGVWISNAVIDVSIQSTEFEIRHEKYMAAMAD